MAQTDSAPARAPDSSGIQPRQIAAVLTIPVLVLVGVNLLLGMLLFFGIDRHSLSVTFLRLFDLNAENNIPTWYNSLLLAAAGVVSIIAWLESSRFTSRFKPAWLLLGLIFFWMSMDESLAFHERTIEPLRTLFDAGGFFYWAWVIPAIAVVIILGVLFIPFVLNLPKKTRCLVIASGALYLSGALIMEMVSGFFFDRYGPCVLSDCSSIVEEMAEMLGVILFIYAAHSYLLSESSAIASKLDLDG